MPTVIREILSLRSSFIFRFFSSKGLLKNKLYNDCIGFHSGQGVASGGAPERHVPLATTPPRAKNRRNPLGHRLFCSFTAFHAKGNTFQSCSSNLVTKRDLWR